MGNCLRYFCLEDEEIDYVRFQDDIWPPYRISYSSNPPVVTLERTPQHPSNVFLQNYRLNGFQDNTRPPSQIPNSSNQYVVTPQSNQPQRRPQHPGNAFSQLDSIIFREQNISPKAIPRFPIFAHPLLNDPKPKIGVDLPPLHIALYNFTQDVLGTINEEFHLSELTWSSNDYQFIKKKFLSTTQSHYEIARIYQVTNMFLYMFYLLTKEEYKLIYNEKTIREEILFHGTALRNVYNICNENFNWRLRGLKTSEQSRNARGLYGNGINFSPISNYASNYCDTGPIKTMIAARVLVCQTCDGNSSMIVPPYYDEERRIRHDTTQKPDGHVQVKYKDDEFYPDFIILFKGEPKQKS